jgi:arsenate reductase
MPDPAATEGSEDEIASSFREAFKILYTRIGLFANLKAKSLDRMSLQQRLKLAGEPSTGATEA